MSAAVIVVRSDGVAIISDRAAVLDGVELMDGVAAPAADAAKLFLTADGVSVAVLGKGTVVLPGGSPLDLRTEALAAAAGIADPGVAGLAVQRRFDELAGTVRGSRWARRVPG